MTSTGTAFSAAAPAARDPTVTCSVKPRLSATSTVSVGALTTTSVTFGGSPSASTFT